MRYTPTTNFVCLIMLVKNVRVVSEEYYAPFQFFVPIFYPDLHIIK